MSFKGKRKAKVTRMRYPSELNDNVAQHVAEGLKFIFQNCKEVERDIINLFG